MKFLLAFSLELASVKTTKQLHTAVNHLLKGVLQFRHSTIFLLNNSRTAARDLFFDPQAGTIENPFCERTATGMHSAEEKEYNFDEISKTGNVLPYLKDDRSPYQGVLFNLYEGNLAIGHWVLLYTAGIREADQPDMDLMHLLANQLSIVVTKIVADDAIRKRDAESEILRSLNIDFVSVRDKDDLLKVMHGKLKKLFDFGHHWVAVINEDQLTITRFLREPASRAKDHPKYEHVIREKYPINDGIFDKVLLSKEPQVFDLDQLSARSPMPGYIQILYESGIRKIVMIGLQVGDRIIGVWGICMINNQQMSLKELNLAKSVSHQLSIAVFNIIANDKIERQLMEIKGYKQQLEEEKIYLREEIETAHNYSEIVGESSPMKKVFRLVSQVAPTDSTVLILGDTGTGKELIARAIHNESSRKNKLMVKVNCAALPANLIESELFGHERGSFTGATDRRIGKFELASGGTLFLDEIGEMPLELQVKLLRALQEREIERVGGRSTIKVDVRIIAATNRDLEKEIAEGRFRSDLYYRLNIFPISLPPLRDRREDIPLLASHFIQRFAKKTGRKIHALHSSALQELMQYTWPGNIRELEHLLERSILQTPGDTIKQICLPLPKQHSAIPPSKETFVAKTLHENERQFILKTLKYCGGRIAGEGGAAQVLGVPPSTLNSKMKRLGIRREYIG
jgi:formate hydrogenlyase transcriptional activator